MNRRFLEKGKDFNDTFSKQQKINEAINNLQWFDLPAKNLPFMQAYALKQMIIQMGNHPDKIAYGTFTNGMGLLAMRNNYNRGDIKRATVYAVDAGDEVINIAVDEEAEVDLTKK